MATEYVKQKCPFYKDFCKQTESDGRLLRKFDLMARDVDILHSH
jgi:hypothetical protein